jgi:hypothetical protein
MRRILLVVCLVVPVLAAACGRDDNGFTPREFTPGEVTDEIRAFRNSAEALLRRDEHEAPELGLQYIKIAVRLEGGGEHRPRLSLTEAEAQAAKVYAKAKAGEDFDRLTLHYSYEGPRTGQRPGAYVVMLESGRHDRGPTVMSRSNFPTAVGDAAWRLEPGEIGAVERHPRHAESGYFIVRRLTDEDLLRDDPTNFPAPNDDVQAMRDAANELLSRLELDERRVTVQHILISRFVTGTGGPDYVRERWNEAESEIKAAEVFKEALETDDFDALVLRETYDSISVDQPGVYAMTRMAADREEHETVRDAMVEHFWKAAWRLEVGEVGVVLYDRRNSPFGYHIMRRID